MSAGLCTECGAENPPEAKFCMSCGAPRGAPALSEERRKATVLFADLSGYTAIAERLDPEDTKALVDHALGRLSREVLEHGGRVDKYIGDNVMAVFGAPVAHEDDPERAVRAGLAMQAAMSEINAEIGARASSRDVELSLRVGINTGEVLAGRSGDQYTVIGDTVNVAARLQAAGARGAVTVGPTTRRLTAAAVEYRELEPFALKGKTEPMPAWEAVCVIDSGSRAEARPAAAPMIGRDEELALLLSLFERVARGARPHLVTVFGEAGVGKSRLLEELATAVQGRGEGVEVLIGRSPAYGTATTYAALGEIIRERFSISAAEPPDAVLDKLSAGIRVLAGGEEDADTARIATQIARLLGVDVRADGDEEPDPEQVRGQVFAAVRYLVQLLAEARPLVLAIEDIHWADEGMLDLIEHIAGSGNGPVLIVCLARDELVDRRPSWGGGRRHATTITLDSLSDEETEALVGSLLAGDERAAEMAGGVAGRSGGNPLFAEEMVNRLRESESASVEELPDSVHAVLAARLDALGNDERRLLQAASVIGESFWEETVTELTGGEGSLAPLDALVEKDLLTPSTSTRVPGVREFSFKHALVRDVAYATLPRAVRARRHSEVAQIIEGRSAANREGVAALLAEHHGRAAALAQEAGFAEEELRGMRSRAARAFQSAGDLAASLYSNAEAISHYDSALRFPGGLDEAERVQVLESRGDTAFRAGHVDTAIESWAEALDSGGGAVDPARAGGLHRKIGSGHWHKGDRAASIAEFQKGIDLLKDGEPSRELIELYEEAASLYVETGDNMLAIYAAEKAQRLAEALGQSATASRAHLTYGRVFGRIGDLEQARRSLERSVELARQSGPAEVIRALLALGRHLEVGEGKHEAAAVAFGEALELANELGDVPAQIELHAALGQLAVHPARWQEVDEHAAVASRLAEREGLSGQLALPLLLQGIAAWRRGEWTGADASLCQSHGIAAEGGRSEVAFSAMLWLAAVDRDRGDFEAARASLEKAAEVCERAGLTAQSVEAAGARVAVLAAAGRTEEARTAAEAAEDVLAGASDPVGVAAATEARGVLESDPAASARTLREAAERWNEAGRPLNSVRARLLLANALEASQPETSAEVLADAASAAEHLGVPHLAARRRPRLSDG